MSTMLTALLLPPVKKGGPGSGPQGGPSVLSGIGASVRTGKPGPGEMHTPAKPMPTAKPKSTKPKKPKKPSKKELAGLAMGQQAARIFGQPHYL